MRAADGSRLVIAEEVHSTVVLTGDRPEAMPDLSEIAGYRLEHRIGVGGFGEVWRAVGPGGFPKAVKILFGTLSGPQAETELRSLNHIRDVRHPFLLNVERVEVVRGQVIVVTELADGSLEQRFRDIVASGKRGIPRDELLGYLRDAADALDFMYEQHGLQHLDIKPENIMLQGSHAKIGDFGLTKCVSNDGHSVINGFTPLYAPPEVFEGRPARGSDQYSLAIVYQMMLTGTAPFNGRTAAQLTAQHLRSAPDLSVLHPADRPIVSRALAKNPQIRFGSCRQFVDDLARRRHHGVASLRPSAGSSPAAGTVTTAVAPDPDKVIPGLALPPSSPLRPAPSDGVTAVLRPTVVIGLGGLGCRVAASLKDKIQAIHGKPVPTVGILLIDSESGNGGDTGSLDTTGIQSVRIPLKTVQEYRKSSSDHLSWLSRRWLFNIPKSGQVEGLRPLGRLAVVTHADRIRSEIRRAIELVCRDTAATEAQTRLNVPCSSNEVDVILVGSTTGGTASGSMFDVAWMSHTAAGIVPDRRVNVSAMLFHGTSSGRTLADMQDANTLSFLKELRYYCVSGIRSSGVAGNSVIENPFHDVWFLHLGDDLTTSDYSRSLSSVADYLELRTLTCVRREMDAWRIAEKRSSIPGAEIQLRTFGLTRQTLEKLVSASSDAACLARALVEFQIHGDPGTDLPPDSAQTSGLAALMAEFGLSSDAAMSHVPKLISPERTRRLDDYAFSLLNRLTESGRTDDVPGRAALLVSSDTAATNSTRNSIASVVDEIRQDLFSDLSTFQSRFDQQFRACVDSSCVLADIQTFLSNLLSAVTEAQTAIGRQKNDLQQAFGDLCDAFAATQAADSAGTSFRNSVKAFCRQYVMLLVCQTACQCMAAHLRSIRDVITKTKSEKLESLRQRLGHLVSLIPESSRPASSMPDELIVRLQASLIQAGTFRLSSLLKRDPRATDAAILLKEAGTCLLHQSSTANSPESQPDIGPRDARPVLTNLGGGHRVVAAVPPQVPGGNLKADLEATYGPCVTLCSVSRSSLAVICETEGIAIASVQDKLGSLKPRVQEMAERVHSRQDVVW